MYAYSWLNLRVFLFASYTKPTQHREHLKIFQHRAAAEL